MRPEGSTRTNKKTIETFENPISKVNTYGGTRVHKTKRKFFKNKAKSKRVRFTI